MRSLALLLSLVSLQALAAPSDSRPFRVQALSGPEQTVDVTWEHNRTVPAKFLIRARSANGDVTEKVSGSRTSTSLFVPYNGPTSCPSAGCTPAQELYTYEVCAMDGEFDFFAKCSEPVRIGLLPVDPPPLEGLTLSDAFRTTQSGRPFIFVKWSGGRDGDEIHVELDDGMTLVVDSATREVLYPLWQPVTLPTKPYPRIRVCSVRLSDGFEKCDGRTISFSIVPYAPVELVLLSGQWEQPPSSAPAVTRFQSTAWNATSFEWDVPSSTSRVAVHRELDNAFGWPFIERFNGTGDGFFSEGSLTSNTTHTYAVCRLNSIGSRCTRFDVELPPAPPLRPLSLRTTLSGALSTTLRVDYEAQTTGEAPVTSVDVTLVGPGGRTRTFDTVTGTATFTGLTPGATYRVDVIARNVSGPSPARSQIIQLPSPLPLAPSVGAESIGPSQVKLGWRNPGGLVPPSSYRVERVSNGAWLLTGNAAGTATSYFEGSLAPSTTYAFRVCAVNAYGTTCSASASATTDALSPDAPTPLKTSTTVPGLIDLRWSSPFTSFEVQRFDNGTWSHVAFTFQKQYGQLVLSGEVWNWRVCALFSGTRACSVDSIARAP